VVPVIRRYTILHTTTPQHVPLIGAPLEFCGLESQQLANARDNLKRTILIVWAPEDSPPMLDYCGHDDVEKQCHSLGGCPPDGGGAPLVNLGSLITTKVRLAQEPWREPSTVGTIDKCCPAIYILDDDMILSFDVICKLPL
jgi:hypothetical protein